MDIYLQAYLVLVSFCFIAQSFLFFHKLEVPGDPVLRKSISMIFLRAFAYFVSVSHFGNSYFKLFQYYYICYNDLRSVIFVTIGNFWCILKLLLFFRYNAIAHLIDYSME